MTGQLRPAVPVGPDRHRHGDWIIENARCPHPTCTIAAAIRLELLDQSPYKAVQRMLEGHNGMVPSAGTCLGCQVTYADTPPDSWADAARGLARHQWEELGVIQLLRDAFSAGQAAEIDTPNPYGEAR